MNSKLLTIIIPTYNYAQRLKNAAESALIQTNSATEVIIIDDGSTDATPVVIDSLLKKHSKFLSTLRQSNSGPAAARNRGIASAKGKYILFLDSDDELLPGALDAIENAIENKPSIDMFLSGHISVSENGTTREHLPTQPSNNREKNFRAYINKKISISHGAFVVKAEKFTLTKYPEFLSNSEDIPLFGHLISNCSIATITNPLVKIYKHSDSLRNQITLTNKGALQVVDALFDPQVLGASYLKYKRRYTASRALSLSRSNFLALDYETSRKWYLTALSHNPLAILKLSYLGKFLKSFYKTKNSHNKGTIR